MLYVNFNLDSIILLLLWLHNNISIILNNNTPSHAVNSPTAHAVDTKLKLYTADLRNKIIFVTSVIIYICNNSFE